jgi:hypothetical protein
LLVSIAEGSDDVLAVDAVSACEIRNRLRDAQRAVATASAQAAGAVGVEQRSLGGRGRLYVAAQKGRVHVGVARGAGPAQTLSLALARGHDTLAFGRGGRGAGAR